MTKIGRPSWRYLPEITDIKQVLVMLPIENKFCTKCILNSDLIYWGSCSKMIVLFNRMSPTQKEMNLKITAFVVLSSWASLRRAGKSHPRYKKPASLLHWRDVISLLGQKMALERLVPTPSPSWKELIQREMLFRVCNTRISHIFASWGLHFNEHLLLGVHYVIMCKFSL